MILLFKLVILTTIISLGWKVAISDGMILGKLGKWFEYKISMGCKIYDWFICPWCFVSIASVFAHAVAFKFHILPWHFDWDLLVRWPIVVLASSFTSGNLWNLYEMTNRIKDRNEEQAKFYKAMNDEDIEFEDEENII